MTGTALLAFPALSSGYLTARPACVREKRYPNYTATANTQVHMEGGRKELRDAFSPVSS
jgi:hypothetical protein